MNHTYQELRTYTVVRLFYFMSAQVIVNFLLRSCTVYGRHEYSVIKVRTRVIYKLSLTFREVNTTENTVTTYI